MNKTSISRDSYLKGSVHTVQGFLPELDAHVIAELLAYQERAGVAGQLCEIGVHHGALFFILALSRRAGERALAIDLFEDDAMIANTRHAGRDRALKINAERLGVEVSEQEFYKTSSLDVKAEDILKRASGPIRFFSIDGGHTYEPVANDLRLAEQTLAPGGIIAVDDFFNMIWADVSFATYDFLKSQDKIVPFAITPAKLYLTTADWAQKYSAALGSRTDLGEASTVPILGREILALRHGVFKRGYQMVRRMITRAS
jgi:hypothetical protein